MNLNKDAYGHEMLAYYNEKNSYEIIEREDGYIDISSGAPSYFKEYKDWKKHEKAAVKLVKGKVLDVGAGVGRISLYLQHKGHDVTAIDNSSLAIKVCKLRGVKKAIVLPIENVDKLYDKFDTVVMFGNNFGLFGGFKKAKILLKKLYDVTSDDVIIIAESNDPHKTTNKVHLAYQRYNVKHGRMPGQLRIRVRFQNYVGEWFDYLLVSKKEMEKILSGTGWKVRKYIDSQTSVYFAVIEKDRHEKVR